MQKNKNNKYYCYDVKFLPLLLKIILQCKIKNSIKFLYYCSKSTVLFTFLFMMWSFFLFCSKFLFLTWSSLAFCPKFLFLMWSFAFCSKFLFLMCRFVQNFYFWCRVSFLFKISIFDIEFRFCPKFLFLMWSFAFCSKFLFLIYRFCSKFLFLM